jgi:CheY-like chemotaxis protein
VIEAAFGGKARGELIDKKKDVLLVVDDESAVCRAIAKMLKSKVDEVLTAYCPEEAELILASRDVTILICDHRFGTDRDIGLALTAEWRAKYPSIRFAALLTGTDVSVLTAPEGVDRIISKSITTKDFVMALGLEAD